MRRQQDFDKFTKGLRQRVEGWVTTSLDDIYSKKEDDLQKLTNIVRSELERIWKHLIEKVNSQEQEITKLKKELENLSKRQTMTKNEFITKRTEIISKMLDNPSETGIYPTTKAFAELDDLYDEMNVHCYGDSEAQKLSKEVMEAK